MGDALFTHHTFNLQCLFHCYFLSRRAVIVFTRNRACIHQLSRCALFCLLVVRQHFCILICLFVTRRYFYTPRFPTTQAQSVGNNTYRTEAHSRCRNHGVQAKANKRKSTRRNRNTKCVVEQSPEQILLNVAHSRTRQIKRCWNIKQIAMHQHNIGA
ncbi:unknown [Eggerthella sp. CAG:1427]|nr:unknown [Eggerthella sp. CAG:1427]